MINSLEELEGYLADLGDDLDDAQAALLARLKEEIADDFRVTLTYDVRAIGPKEAINVAIGAITARSESVSVRVHAASHARGRKPLLDELLGESPNSCP